MSASVLTCSMRQAAQQRASGGRCCHHTVVNVNVNVNNVNCASLLELVDTRVGVDWPRACANVTVNEVLAMFE
jgi:hypothetical protein